MLMIAPSGGNVGIFGTAAIPPSYVVRSLLPLLAVQIRELGTGEIEFCERLKDFSPPPTPVAAIAANRAPPTAKGTPNPARLTKAAPPATAMFFPVFV